MSRILSIAVALWLLLASPHLMAQSDESNTGHSISEALRDGKEFLTAEGSGLPARWAKTDAAKRISAIAAAEVVARANLLIIVQGAAIDVKRNVNNSEMTISEINERASGMLKGAQIYKKSYTTDGDGRATAHARMPITGRSGLYHTLLPLLESTNQNFNRTEFEGQPDPTSRADGLIIDLRGDNLLDFEPALVQFILTEQGEVLYGPDQVSKRLLVKRGMVAYSGELGKAKAILSEVGSTNPMIIAATGLNKNNQPKVSKKDANSIFSANQNKQFLEQAKVVFLLGI